MESTHSSIPRSQQISSFPLEQQPSAVPQSQSPQSLILGMQIIETDLEPAGTEFILKTVQSISSFCDIEAFKDKIKWETYWPLKP